METILLIVWFVILILLRMKLQGWPKFDSAPDGDGRWIAKPWRESKDYLERITSDLTNGELKNRYAFSGKFRRRQFTISYSPPRQSFIHPLKRKKSELDFTFQIVQKFWLRLLRQVEQPEDQILTGNPRLDNTFCIHSDQPALAVGLLKEQLVTTALLKELFPFDRLEIYRGAARLKILSPAVRGFRRSHLDKLMDRLSVMLDIYEAQKLQITVDVRRASSICPYCREELGDRNENTVTCPSCGTIHHLACWKENKQCTTWGCDSTAAG